MKKYLFVLLISALAACSKKSASPPDPIPVDTIPKPTARQQLFEKQDAGFIFVGLTDNKSIEGSTNYHVFSTSDNFKTLDAWKYNPPTGMSDFISTGATLLHVHHSGSEVLINYSKNYGRNITFMAPVFDAGVPPADLRNYAFADEKNIIMSAGQISPTQSGYSYQTFIYGINVDSGKGTLITVIDDYYAYSTFVRGNRIWMNWSSKMNIYDQFITGYISHSDDGGATWSSPVLVDAGGSFAIAAGSDNDLFVYSQEGAYLSRDAGITWTKTNANGIIFRHVQFADSQTLYALGNDFLMKSVDGGLNWSKIEKVAGTYTVWGIPKFINPSDGIVYDDQNIFLTDDGGNTFKHVMSRWFKD